ncbi:Oidioi.mRNA.OKI2018_I69.chr1.g1844.t1.cds [Oikopleura dioica]|uniref:Oidioi.mRNA.OKI2018_I69.chr1.g1844.t1.cds n=1 Tax=Oikopleura dioica TaxID=34765 RepID=A0ABN7ST17_OIKDI|nr:Oidioi.mRNA.OKI2018_I69.chr1.g1844.t1.cds [Oikopleura dioica]
MRSVLSRPIASLRNSLRRGGEWHAPTPEQMRGAQNNWLYMHFFSERGWFPAESNTTYETELARISKELGWDAEHAHLPAADFTLEERRYWAWNDRFWTISIGFALGLFPFMTDYLGNQSEHSRREAILRIREAAAAGKSPIDPDYVPNELIESMVPPAGDWEKIWLSRQPSTMSRGSAKWCW